MSLKGTRTDYGKQALGDDYKTHSPLDIFNSWLSLAKNTLDTDYNAMIISTNSLDGFPASRIVLLREVNNEGFVFYTNYNSDKGKEIQADPKVSMNFFWRELEKQIRIRGVISKISAEKSDEYFQSRPRKSQIGAWVSDQSSVIESREQLVQKEIELTKKLEGSEVPRPENWGGYIVQPSFMEFWQGRSGRLHDRLRFTLEKNQWRADRLSP